MGKKVIILRGKKMADTMISKMAFFGGHLAPKLVEKVSNKLPEWLVLPSELNTEKTYEAHFAKETFAKAHSESVTEKGSFTAIKHLKEFGDAFVAAMTVNPTTLENSGKKNSSLTGNKSGLLGAAASQSKGLGLDFVKQTLGENNLAIPGL